MSLALAIAGNSINYTPRSFQLVQDTILSWSLSFTVEDAPGSNHYTHRMPVTATDSVKGLIFAGFIDQPDETNLYPNTQNEIAIKCIDYRTLAGKRRPTSDYSNMQAGDIVIDMLSNYLTAEGVTATYAYRSDQTQTGFAAGTLTGVTATNNLPPGDLELTPAGSNVTNNDNMAVFTTQATIAADTFTRANQTGWGTASDGEPWAFFGHAATESITSNEGVISANLGSNTWAQLGTQVLGDQQLQCRIAINNTADSGGLMARSSSAGGTGYQLLWYSGAIHLNKSVGGTVTSDIASSVTFTMTPGTFYQFKLACTGNTITGKVWQDGTTEPVSWMLTATDTSIASGGFVLQATSSTGTGVQFDHFTVSGIGGSSTSVDVHNNQLNLHAYNVIKLTGTCAFGGNNAFVYWKIWSGSQAIAGGNYIEYDVWISSTSPQIMAGVDFVCTDGTTMRDFIVGTQRIQDQFGFNAHPGTDLSGFANDQWYHRKIDISAMAGKTISFVSIAFEGDNVGNYQAYFRNVKLTTNSSTILTFYDSTTHPYDPQNAVMNQNSQVSNNVYANVNVQSVTAYDQTGSRISNAINIDPVKVVGSSEVSWYSVVPVGIAPASQVSGSTAPAVPAGTSITVLTSIDSQITWQAASYAASIPNLESGFNVTGRNLYTQVQLAITGTTPEVTPAVSALSTLITTASISGTTNALACYDSTANFGTGVNSNTQNWLYGSGENTPASNGDVTLSGMFYNWYPAGYVGQTLFGSSSPAQSNYKRQMDLTTGTGTDVKSRIDGYGSGNNSFQNFTAQVLVQCPPANANIGLSYRTTGWSNTNNTYAYNASINVLGVNLDRGTNGGTNSVTAVAAATVTLTAGNWYTLKVVVNGNNHQVYVDEVLYINATDTTYPNAGQIGLRFYNNTGNLTSGYFQNFGVVNALTGTWTSPAVSLNALGTIGNSAIFWNSVVPNGGSLTCASSIDGGTTWQAVAQGGQIGNAAPGTSVVGKSVQLQFTFTSPNASVTPVLQSVSIWATSQVTASGTRVSPVLNLFNGRAGGNSLTWSANLPTGCTLGMDISPDGTTWTDVSSANGQPLPSSIMKTQPDPWLDFFAANSSASYTSTFLDSGVAATWTWDTVNKQLVGVQPSNQFGTLQYPGFTTFADMFVEADFNYSDTGGLVARMVDGNNAYFLSINDSAASASQNTVILRKIVAGTRTTLLQTSIAFTRGDYHRFRLDVQGSTITTFMDGVQIQQVTDTGVTAAGMAGVFAGQNTGASTKVQVLSLRVQPYGDTVNGKALYTRQRLASTNPSATPQVTNVTLSVRDPEIGTGALIANTNYAYKNTVATSYDDLAKQSTSPNPYLWYIDPSLGLHFKQNRATPAPFYIFAGQSPATSTMLANPVPKVSSPDMNYCNRITVDGGTDLSSVPAITKMGDGITQTWLIPGNLGQAPIITRNGTAQRVGVKGVDTGKDFYYQIGSNVISQDPSETPPGATDTLVFSNLFIQVPVRVTLDNTNGSGIYAGTVGQTQLAAIDRTSGIVHDYLSVPGLSTSAATALAQSQLIQRGRLGQNITFSTKKWGLQAGMLALIMEPQQGVINQPFVITKITITLQPAVGSTDPDVIGGILYTTVVEATSGPIIGSWTRLFSEMLGAVAGNIR